MYNYKILNCDTDSIMIAKLDGSPFTKEEQDKFLFELNSLYPEEIKFEHDGIFDSTVILKAKNYVLKSGSKVKIKGSALKATTKEPALQQMIKDVVDELLNKDSPDILTIYRRYVLEALNVTDISRWCSKKTITEAVLNPSRTNEQKVADALVGTEYSAGDKRYFFFRKGGSLCLREKFSGDYDENKLLEKIYKTLQIFSTVLDMSQFPKYHLKTKRKELELLLAKAG